MRVVVAQDMPAAAIDQVSTMHAGGRKSPNIVMQYAEHLDVLKSGMYLSLGCT